MESKKEADLCRIEWCDKPIVRVLGTVMTRDDNLGGWVPYMNGGQSKVGIHESVDRCRYRIYGWRVNDKQVTLDCFIQRNMVFHETIGTFHHWKIGEKKMGLTFYTPAEARAFNRGVRVALEQLTKVAEYTSSSASSTCSRLSEDHHSSCTSPTTSTGSSSPCEISNSFRQKLLHENKKKLSTSSTSSSSSRQGTRKRSTGVKHGRAHRVAHSSSSSNTSTQNQTVIGNHNSIAPVTASMTLSLLSSTTSPRFCDTPSSTDLGQHQFRWPLPQQQPYPTNLTFLNRPINKDGSPYELSALALPSPLPTTSSNTSREPENNNPPKPQVSRNTAEETEQEEKIKKCETALSPQHSFSAANANERDANHLHHADNQQTSPNHGRSRGHHRSAKPRHTKTPHLDILERQRDLKPTEPNSYVIFSSSKPATTLGSQRIGGRSIMTTGMPTTLPGMRSVEHKALCQMTLMDGYRYGPILSTMRGNSPPYQHPQTGTLSIMASTTDATRYYNRADSYHASNIESLKDETIFCEPGSSLISSPKKSKYKGTMYSESTSDIEGRGCLPGTLCCCPCLNTFSSHRRSASTGRMKEDLAERSKCRHCRKMFNHERNPPGACRDAPDKCLHTINKVSCMFCVNSLFYHCCRDDEGDYDDEPCSCSDSRGGGRTKLVRRWSALAALSIIFPCLCLYPPLRACHSCGVACHCCGGKHQAHFPSTKSTDKRQSKR